MATSAVSICSNALLLLGDKPISDFSENSDRTRLVANLYEQKRDRVLRAHPWNCATRRVVLSPDETSPAFGWRYQFDLPADCLRVVSVGEDHGGDEFSVESGKILLDSPVCNLRYIWRNTVEATWDTLLVDAMTQVMVAALAYPITKSTSKQAGEEEIVRDLLRLARTVDGQESSGEVFGDFPFLANRAG